MKYIITLILSLSTLYSYCQERFKIVINTTEGYIVKEPKATIRYDLDSPLYYDDYILYLSPGTYRFDDTEYYNKHTKTAIFQVDSIGQVNLLYVSGKLKFEIIKENNNWEDWEVSLFWERNFYPELQTIANDLYKRGLIKKGNYTINIDW